MSRSSRESAEPNGDFHAHHLYDLAQKAECLELKALAAKVQEAPLRELNLSHNALMYLLAETNYNDLEIDIPDCPLKIIIDMIISSNVKILNLSWNHYYAKDGSERWSSSDSNTEFTNLWIKFSVALKSISSLNLSWNQLNTHGHFANFCDALKEQKFDYLDLSFNKLEKPEEIAALAKLEVRSLKFCGNLTQSLFSDDLLKELLNLISASKSLRILNISHNKLHCLNPPQFDQLCIALSKSHIITLIVNEPLSEKEKANLKNAEQVIDRFPVLTRKNLAANQFDPAQIDRLYEIVKQNRLKELPSLKLHAMRKLWCEPAAKVSAVDNTAFFYQSSQHPVRRNITKDLKEDIEQLVDIIDSPVIYKC